MRAIGLEKQVLKYRLQRERGGVCNPRLPNGPLRRSGVFQHPAFSRVTAILKNNFQVRNDLRVICTRGKIEKTAMQKRIDKKICSHTAEMFYA